MKRSDKSGWGTPWPLKVIGALIFIPALIFLVSWLGMMLWNTLMPMIFNLPALSFWQAMGLILLAKIFFGFGGNSRGRKFFQKSRFKDSESWHEHMSECCSHHHDHSSESSEKTASSQEMSE